MVLSLVFWFVGWLRLEEDFLPRRDLSAAEVSLRSEECAAWLPPIDDDDDDGRKAGRGVRERDRVKRPSINRAILQKILWPPLLPASILFCFMP